MKFRIAPRTAVLSSTRRSQGLRALVIGQKATTARRQKQYGNSYYSALKWAPRSSQWQLANLCRPEGWVVSSFPRSSQALSRATLTSEEACHSFANISRLSRKTKTFPTLSGRSRRARRWLAMWRQSRRRYPLRRGRRRIPAIHCGKPPSVGSRHALDVH